jgi:hypothetical protein
MLSFAFFLRKISGLTEGLGKQDAGEAGAIASFSMIFAALCRCRADRPTFRILTPLTMRDRVAGSLERSKAGELDGQKGQDEMGMIGRLEIVGWW